jgi:hypothetical protein
LGNEIKVLDGELREGNTIELYVDFSSDFASHLAVIKKWYVFFERNVKYNPDDDAYYFEEPYYGSIFEATDTDTIPITNLQPGRLFCWFEYRDYRGVWHTLKQIFKVKPKFQITAPVEIIEGEQVTFKVTTPSVLDTRAVWLFNNNGEYIISNNVSKTFSTDGYFPYNLYIEYGYNKYLDETFINWESNPSSKLVGVTGGGIFGGEGVQRWFESFTESVSGNYLVKYDLTKSIALDFQLDHGFDDQNGAPLLVTFKDLSSYGELGFDTPTHRLEYVEIAFGDGEIIKKTEINFEQNKIYNNSGTYTGSYIVHTLHSLSGSNIEYRQSISKNFEVSVNPFFDRWFKDHTQESLFNSQGFNDIAKGWGLQMDRLYNDAKDFIESIDVEKINDSFVKSFFNTYGDFPEIAEKVGFKSFTDGRDDKFSFFNDYNFFDRLEKRTITPEEKKEFIDYVRDSIKSLQNKGTPSSVEREIKRFRLLGTFVELWITDYSKKQTKFSDNVFVNNKKTETGLTYRNVSTPSSDNVNVPIGNNKYTPYIEVNTIEDSVAYHYTDESEIRIIDGVEYAVFNKPNNGVVKFQQSSYTVAETAGSITVPVLRSGSFTGKVSVKYATTVGTANDRSDYFAVNGELVWEDGDSTSKSITVKLIDDSEYEAQETFAITLYDPKGGATLGSKNSTIITITSDDPVRYGQLQFTQLLYEANEEDGFVDIEVRRVNGYDGIITVDYSTSDGTALVGEDYLQATGTLTWADKDTDNKTFRAYLINDVEREGSETIELALTNATGGATLGFREFATISIVLNDVPEVGTIQFENLTSAVLETMGEIQIVVKRVGGTLGVVTVEYETRNDTAIAGIHYSSVMGTLTWNSGENDDKVITIPIVDDSDNNEDRLFSVLLRNPTGGANLGESTHVVSIQNDEAENNGVIQFQNTVYNVNEEDGSVILGLTRTGGFTGIVSARYFTENGTATYADYEPSSEYVVWFNGDSLNKGISIDILNNNEYTGVRTFSVTLSDPTGGATIGTNSTAFVNITDDEDPQYGILSFVNSQYVVSEQSASSALGDGDFSKVSVGVQRTGGFDGAVSVDYEIVASSATEGVDYYADAYAGTLTWANGEFDIKSFEIQILEDSIFEDDEVINVFLKNPVSAVVGLSASIVTIEDNENGEFRFSSSIFSANEAISNITTTIERYNGKQGLVTVDYITMAGTALEGVDYIKTQGTLSWADQDNAPKNVIIPLINDGFKEGTETFYIQLSNPTGGAALSTPISASLSIVDDEFTSDNGVLKFESSLYSVTENASTVQIVVTREEGSSGNITVDYATANGTAIAGTHYLTKSGTLGWAAGDNSSKSFFVTILNNSEYDFASPRSFKISLSNPSGGALIVIGETTVNITEDDVYTEKVWYFDGIDNRVDLSSQIKPYSSSNQAYAIGFWANFYTLSDGGTVFKIYDETNPAYNILDISKGSDLTFTVGGSGVGVDATELTVSGISGNQYYFTWIQDISGDVKVYVAPENGTLSAGYSDTYTANMSSSENYTSTLGAYFNGSSYSDYCEMAVAWFGYWEFSTLPTVGVLTAIREGAFNGGQIPVDLTLEDTPPNIWYRFGNTTGDAITNSSGGLKDYIGSNDANPFNFSSGDETDI